VAKNIWLLTEERPKPSVILSILERFCSDNGFGYSVGDAKVLPIMDEQGHFTFCYKFIGVSSKEIKRIFILPVSGYSSFVDFMLFYQDERPTDKDQPWYLIEETKTDGKESRNTGVYQRCSKFVYCEHYYPGVKRIMLYNIHGGQAEKHPPSIIFGTRMLLTIGVDVMGKQLDPAIFRPFETIDDLVDYKNKMNAPGYGQKVEIKRTEDAIYISAKLEKYGKLEHDPTIGMVSLIADCLRKFGWAGRIVITDHGVTKYSATGKNKFNYIARICAIELEGLDRSNVAFPNAYWQLEKEREKSGTILAHILCENEPNGKLVYENHGGCERGYFYEYSTGSRTWAPVEKYEDKVAYKAGDKKKIVHLPDLVIFDKKRNEVTNMEGKTYRKRQDGIEELDNFNAFEKLVRTFYGDVTIKRALVLAGSGDSATAKKIPELCLYLDSEGVITLGDSAPAILKDAVANLAAA